MQNDPRPGTPGKEIIDTRFLRMHPEYFQKTILVAAIKSSRFYFNMKSRLCPYEAGRKSRRPDFQKMQYNRIFGLVSDYWNQLEPHLDRCQDYSISLANMEEMLRSEMDNGRLSQLDAQVIFDALKQDMELVEFGSGFLPTLHMNPLITAWLERRAAVNLVDFAYQIRTLKPPSLRELKAEIDKTLTDLSLDANIAPTPLGNLPRAGPDYNKHLVGHRWLYRGGSIMLVGPTGTGKSSFAIQLGIHWASGKPCFGLKPAGPLRVLYVQAENDPEDVAEVRDDVYKGLAIPASDQEVANRNFTVIHKVDATGTKFIAWLAGVLASHPCDVLIVDPLMAYIGGDVTQQSVTSEFLREGLQPLISKHNVGVLVVHHPPKPKVDNPKETAQADSYFGAGSADIPNWVRGVMVLKGTNQTNLFKLRLPKRGKRAGWMAADGITPRIEMDVAHGRGGLIYWREADSSEGFLPKKAATVRADILAMIPQSGKIWQEQVIELAGEKPIGRNKTLGTLKLLEADGLISVVKVPRPNARPAIAYTRGKA